MDNHCIPCEEARLARLKGRQKEREALIQKLNEKYKDQTVVKTGAIVETRNGFLGYREIGEEGFDRLPRLEYLSFLPGIAAK